MSCSSAAPINKFELTLDEQDVAAVQRTPCATPRGYRAIPLDIKPTTWKADLSKCNVCEARFTWLNHRHKCRKCMEAVCNSCSKDRKVVRAHTAPKRVCDNCIKNCWTPRDKATTPRKPTAADTADNKPVGRDGRRISLTVSASDANACPVVATATAPLSPGTPAAAGFFGPGCVTPSTTLAPAPTPADGVAGDTNTNITTTTTSVDTRPPSSSSRRRSHRRQVSVAMPSLPPASPAASAPASASPPTTTMMMLPPPTPAAAIGEEDEAEVEEAVPPPSAAASPSSSSPAPPALFFGGRQGAVRRGRRESSGGRLESRVWGGERALGGGGDVDKAVAGLLQLREETVEVETEGQEGRQAEAAAGVEAAAALPALPEEPVDAAPAAAAASSDAAAAAADATEEGDDYGEGGPMMMKITAWSGAALGGVAIGTGVVVAVLLRSAVSLVFCY